MIARAWIMQQDADRREINADHAEDDAVSTARSSGGRLLMPTHQDAPIGWRPLWS